MGLGKGIAVSCMGALALAMVSNAGAQQRTVVGTLPDGTKVETFTLSDGSGMQARVLTLGAALHSLDVPDRDGKYADVVLGYATLDGHARQAAVLRHDRRPLRQPHRAAAASRWTAVNTGADQ